MFWACTLLSGMCKIRSSTQGYFMNSQFGTILGIQTCMNEYYSLPITYCRMQKSPVFPPIYEQEVQFTHSVPFQQRYLFLRYMTFDFYKRCPFIS